MKTETSATDLLRDGHMAIDGHALTFASFFDDPRRFKHLKLPSWLFPMTYERRDQASLSGSEHERFLCAFNVMIANGTFEKLVDIHSDMSHHMHANERFLPWHRVYLLQLEHALRSIHPDVAIPYWDWTQAGEEAVPLWIVSFAPTIVTPTQMIPVTRAPGAQADLAMIVSNIPNVLGLTDFANFAFQLESVHNAVHVWVGGSMSSIPTAPADPLFWMHHANIDRLWRNWQKSVAGTGKNPNLVGPASVMDPWAMTEPDTRDINSLGYTYE